MARQEGLVQQVRGLDLRVATVDQAAVGAEALPLAPAPPGHFPGQVRQHLQIPSSRRRSFRTDIKRHLAAAMITARYVADEEPGVLTPIVIHLSMPGPIGLSRRGVALRLSENNTTVKK